MNLPNKLTLLRIFLIPVFIIVFYQKTIPYWNFIAAGIFIIASITDALDGQIARKNNQITSFGKLMDPVADKILIVTAILLMVEWGRFPALVAIVIIGRELLVNGIRMIAVSSGNVIAASWMGKLKTITQIVAVCAVLMENFLFKEIGIPFDQIMIYVALFFTIWSGIDYIMNNLQVFSQKQ